MRKRRTRLTSGLPPAQPCVSESRGWISPPILPGVTPPCATPRAPPDEACLQVRHPRCSAHPIRGWPAAQSSRRRRGPDCFPRDDASTWASPGSSISIQAGNRMGDIPGSGPWARRHAVPTVQSGKSYVSTSFWNSLGSHRHSRNQCSTAFVRLCSRHSVSESRATRTGFSSRRYNVNMMRSAG